MYRPLFSQERQGLDDQESGLALDCHPLGGRFLKGQGSSTHLDVAGVAVRQVLNPHGHLGGEAEFIERREAGRSDADVLLSCEGGGDLFQGRLDQAQNRVCFGSMMFPENRAGS